MALPDKLCAEIAERQFGLIARSQALRAGMSPSAIARRLQVGRWYLDLPRVYRLAGAPKTWEQALRAATLWGGDRCAVSHDAAAALHGLTTFRAREVHIQSAKQLRHAGVVTHLTQFVDSQYVTLVKGIPTTSVTRTLVDLSGTVPRKTLEKVLDEAIRLRMTDLPRVRGVLSRAGTKRHGGKILRALLKARDGSAERSDSELEDKLIRLIRSQGLPPPTVHYNVVDDDRWLGEVDLAYPRERIAIEVHGYRIHSVKRTWENDQRRENELVQSGWRVLKATSSQLENDPDSFIAGLRLLLNGAKKANRSPARARR